MHISHVFPSNLLYFKTNLLVTRVVDPEELDREIHRDARDAATTPTRK